MAFSLADWLFAAYYWLQEQAKQHDSQASNGIVPKESYVPVKAANSCSIFEMNK